MQSGRKGSKPEVSNPSIFSEQNADYAFQSLTESEKRHFSAYGKWPIEKSNNAKGQTLFKMGELSCQKAIDDVNQTRTSHLLQDSTSDSTSNAYVPIPAASNINEHAIEDLHRKSSYQSFPLFQSAEIDEFANEGDSEKKGN
ncbi:hypothetical protein N7476_004891 [Penicillium atrosanguineum]|uniref:Uncharacterized protein n=1 Tax=Penicillium atrosanguineum TaxID=1132637 RepID=A0A9W9PYE6_9EURO|nr:hypothetical protein N7526_001807 [Penicillium atrosanguineum]KAJ5318360.1 hypothetical protein N7476_004780 [Penicillium atrosanguineum]KAJ5318471.1 hypothetical protein N7476_004891 [Penicillium atrosanguineum]